MPCFLTKRCATGRSRATETVRHGLWMLLLFHHVPRWFSRSQRLVRSWRSGGATIVVKVDSYCLHALSLTLFHLFHSCDHPQRWKVTVPWWPSTAKCWSLQLRLTEFWSFSRLPKSSCDGWLWSEQFGHLWRRAGPLLRDLMEMGGMMNLKVRNAIVVPGVWMRCLQCRNRHLPFFLTIGIRFDEWDGVEAKLRMSSVLLIIITRRANTSHIPWQWILGYIHIYHVWIYIRYTTHCTTWLFDSWVQSRIHVLMVSLVAWSRPGGCQLEGAGNQRVPRGESFVGRSAGATRIDALTGCQLGVVVQNNTGQVHFTVERWN